MQRLVDLLVQARLLVVQTGSGVATVEIVHESLLHSWPTLKRWLEESSEDAAFLDQLRTASRQWQQKNFDADLVWRGELAEEAKRFQRRFRGQLPDVQHNFLAAIVDADARSARRQRMLTIGGVAFLLLLVAASAVALVVISRAQQEAEKQAVVASGAQAEAEARLVEVQAKEKQRARAQSEAEEARTAAEKAATELRGKQGELIEALDRAEKAAEEARVAEGRAKTNAWEALGARQRAEEAKARADAARREVSTLLTREQERARKLEEQLGGGVIDTLK